MLRRLAKVVALGGLAVGAGCLAPTLPIPPPGGTATVVACMPPASPPDGLVVTVRGHARPGAFVVVENLSRQRADGMRYVASSTATTMDDVTAGRAPEVGLYEVVLEPRADGAGGVLASRMGDRVSVFQYVELPEGVQRSLPLELVVGR
jgi:hypothetical protein